MPNKMSEREKDKKAQETRSKRYHIAIKEGGHVTKPSQYKHLSDEQFGDPVNYRYPIDKEHIHGAITYWAKPKNQEQYSSGEKKIISDRIEKAKKKFKIGEYKEAKNYFIGKTIELKGAPEEIQITALGVFFHKIYGRFEVTREDVAQMVANFNLQENDSVIDYEHQTLLDVEAPAAGWIKILIDKGGDGLWGKVEWLERAKGYLEKKEYKYLSPVITYNNHNPKTGEYIGTVLVCCGITNVPFITGMEPLVNKQPLKEEVEMIEKIKELLGLPADALDEDVISKIEALLGASKKVEEFAGKFTEILSKLGLKEDTTTEEITAKIDALKESKKEDDPRLKEITSELDLKEDAKTEEIKAKLVALKKSKVLPDGFVAKNDFDELKEKFDTKERDEMVNETIRAGKIGSEEHLEWAKEYALKDPAGFKKWAENAPIIADPQKIVLAQKGPEKFAMTEEDKKVADMLGVSEKSFKKYNTS